MKYVGNKAGWLTKTAAAIMDGGNTPPSVTSLISSIPKEIGTASHDGHQVAAVNGHDKKNIKAGYKIWIEGVVEALREAKLVGDDDDALEWLGDPDQDHKVKFAGNDITVYGSYSRKVNRDRYMLGAQKEPVITEEDLSASYVQSGLARDGRVLRGEIDPLTLNVHTRNNGKDYFNDMKFEIHPLALAIPPMTEAEQVMIRKSIEANGVKVPIITYRDAKDLTPRGKAKLKVLDGRHRAYFASILDKPVKLEEFQGTEREARDHVASLNLHRRHLTPQQRGLSAVLLYGEQAKKEAKTEQRKHGDTAPGRPNTSEESPGSDNGRKRGKEAHEIVWELAGGEAAGFSKDTAKAMMEVAKAPETSAAVQGGDIKSTEKARRAARAETEGTVERVRRAPGENISTRRSINRHLGNALSSLKVVCKVLEEGTESDDELDVDKLIKRTQDIHAAATRAANLIEQRRTNNGRVFKIDGKNTRNPLIHR